MMTLAQAHALLPGSRWWATGAHRAARVHTDTRTLRAGDLFVALQGRAIRRQRLPGPGTAAGAVAALAERGLAEAGLPGLQVADTLAALQQLAARLARVRRCR
jgi:UDP-N-acetylmuramyl pentapeptide synthase